MILVDTSVLVSYLAGRKSPAVTALQRLLDDDGTFYLAPVIVQEVLQGARDEREWKLLASYLEGQALVDAADPALTAVAAARLYFLGRRRGLTIRSSVDCWIAQLAIEHELTLLHDDRDYAAIATVSALRQTRG